MTPRDTKLDRDARGHLYGLLAAALFGVSPPLCKRLLGEVSPLVLSGCLYLAGGLALSLFLGARSLFAVAPREAKLRRADAPWLLAVMLLGGFAGPLLMLLGLSRLSGLVGSLLLNLEAPLTMAWPSCCGRSIATLTGTSQWSTITPTSTTSTTSTRTTTTSRPMSRMPIAMRTKPSSTSIPTTPICIIGTSTDPR